MNTYRTKKSFLEFSAIRKRFSFCHLHFLPCLSSLSTCSILANFLCWLRNRLLSFWYSLLGIFSSLYISLWPPLSSSILYSLSSFFFSASFRKKNQWPAWAYCPARQPVLSFTLLLSYLFSPQSPLSQPNLCRSIPSRCSPTPLASLMFFASLFTSLSHRNFFSALSILKFYITFSVVSNPLAMFSHLKFISPLCKASLPITLPPPVVSDDFCGFSFFLVCLMYLWILPLRFFCCRHLRAASGIPLLPLPGWASPWLPFALFYAALASPTQDKLSGLWGGCSFTFHTFHPSDMNCLRVFLATHIS